MATPKLITRNGRRYTPDFDAALLDAEKEAGGVWRRTQGGWNGGAVGASAGTHDEDAVDYDIGGKTKAQVAALITALRKRGLFASLRTASKALWGVRAQGFAVVHIHVVPNLWGYASAGAEYQAREYRAGRDGLKGKGPDKGGPGHTRAYTSVTWPGYLAAKRAAKSAVKYRVATRLLPLNGRSGPGTKYRKVTSAKRGTVLTIVSTKSGWAKDTKGRWWRMAYLKKA
jgi:hypothetical protein